MAVKVLPPKVKRKLAALVVVGLVEAVSSLALGNPKGEVA